jgi:DNA-binding transcriptional LysR family regulator
MQTMHEFIRTPPFDLYKLSLLQLVAKYQNFTKAATAAGLTQSAMTRQIQGMEESLGVQLFERNTRNVEITPAGKYLCSEAERLLGTVDKTLRSFSEQFSGARKEVRVGVSRTVSFAYLPGFFHANLRDEPRVGYRIRCEPSKKILSALENNEEDLCVVCPPARLASTLRITHRFDDAFTAIAPASLECQIQQQPENRIPGWLKAQNWLLIDDTSNTGQRLRDWMYKQNFKIKPTMQLDNFDLIINLVSLGMGVSFVPIRALAAYNAKQKVCRVVIRKRFTRELVVVVRNNRKVPEHIERFVANVLF